MSARSWLAAPPPDAALDIGSDALALTVIGTRGAGPTVQGYAIEPLPAGAVVPSLTGRNVADRGAVLTALRAAVDRLGLRPRRLALVVPDLAAKVSLVHFERVPAGRDDLDQLIRWQLRKAAPFPLDEAQVTYMPGVRGPEGAEFLVLLARREVVREYESMCEEAGMHPGLVDLSTLAVVDLALAAGPPPAGDSLLIHVRPESTSLAILRGQDVIFFRTRPEGEEGSLADLVHQTTMYYQDRLSGRGFARVRIGGASNGPLPIAAARAALEERLGTPVEPIDPARAVTFGERTAPRPELVAALSPAIGILLRTRAATVSA